MFREPYARLFSEFRYVNKVCAALESGELPDVARGILSAIGFDMYVVVYVGICTLWGKVIDLLADTACCTGGFFVLSMPHECRSCNFATDNFTQYLSDGALYGYVLPAEHNCKHSRVVISQGF